MPHYEGQQSGAFEVVAAVDQDVWDQPLSNPAPQGHLGTIEGDSRLGQCVEPRLSSRATAGHVIWFDMLKRRQLPCLSAALPERSSMPCICLLRSDRPGAVRENYVISLDVGCRSTFSIPRLSKSLN